MELILRPPNTRFHPLMRPRWRGLRGLGDGTCQYPQPGVPMVYPPCPRSSPIASAPAAPRTIPLPACTLDNQRAGGAAFSAECIAQLEATQHQNQSAADAANRAVFVADCNANWQLNAEQFRNRGLEVPPNDCAFRGYGQTLPGTTGGTMAYLPGTPQNIITWREQNPGGGSPGPVAGANESVTGAGGGWTADAITPPKKETAPPILPPKKTANPLTETIDLGGNEIPVWAIGVAVLAAVFFMVKK